MSSPHSWATRLLHGSLATAVCFQLLTSLIMQAPSPSHAENVFFELHKNSGIIVVGLVLLFWGVIVTRRFGTPADLLFPSFRACRRAALMADVKRHAWALRRRSLPDFQDASPLAAAGHGLGFLLVTVMAATGIIWEIVRVTGVVGEPGQGLLLGLHSLTSTFVWAYLIIHGLMALFHHFSGEQSLRSMWSIGRTGSKGRAQREG